MRLPRDVRESFPRKSREGPRHFTKAIRHFREAFLVIPMQSPLVIPAQLSPANPAKAPAIPLRPIRHFREALLVIPT